ncbi:UNVERIFIED_CONTAM: hypothetical protein Slati_1889100 [Sesamum latifolium]|uniref:F-box domain-containing protein n=1 Tax=Sesamum latifolium TaxID=2727402 RepID=A0AAW2X066_9LAMI
MGSQESTLSDDMVFDILTRLKSLETLDACKLVCKGWEEMIYESSFMPLYCRRSRMLSGFFIQDMIDNKFFSMFAAIDGSTTSHGLSRIDSSDDMVFDILTRLKSLETLDACKLVCKGWEEMIYESSFMPLYCRRSRMLSGFFIQDMIDNKFFSMFAAIDGSTTSYPVNIKS